MSSCTIYTQISNKIPLFMLNGIAHFECFHFVMQLNNISIKLIHDASSINLTHSRHLWSASARARRQYQETDSTAAAATATATVADATITSLNSHRVQLWTTYQHCIASRRIQIMVKSMEHHIDTWVQTLVCTCSLVIPVAIKKGTWVWMTMYLMPFRL